MAPEHFKKHGFFFWGTGWNLVAVPAWSARWPGRALCIAFKGSLNLKAETKQAKTIPLCGVNRCEWWWIRRIHYAFPRNRSCDTFESSLRELKFQPVRCFAFPFINNLCGTWRPVSRPVLPAPRQRMQRRATACSPLRPSRWRCAWRNWMGMEWGWNGDGMGMNSDELGGILPYFNIFYPFLAQAVWWPKAVERPICH